MKYRSTTNICFLQKQGIEMLTNCTLSSFSFVAILLLSTLTSCSDDSTDLVFDPSNDEVTDESKIRFTKVANSDWKLADNQDRITSNVWLTRGSEGLLFNAKVASFLFKNIPKLSIYYY